MTLESLEKLQDEELLSVIERSRALLNDRDAKRKEKALGDAREILARAGLTPQDLGHKRKGAKPGNGTRPTYHTGHQYQHPTNKALVWNAKGQKPNWLRDLEEQGGKAIEI
jgi:DNA-binding protein H-NS